MRSALVLMLVLLAVVPASATAQEVGAAAMGLGQSPLYVDPSLRSALTEQERTDLEARLSQASPPVLVALIPLVAGDAVDGKPRPLLAVLRKRLGRDDAVLLTVNDGILTAEPPSAASEAEQDRLRAVSSYTNLVDHDYNERLATTLNRYLDSLADPDILDKAEQASDDLSDRANDRGGTSPSVPASGGTGDGFPTALVALLAAALLLVGSLFVVRRRRGAHPAPAGPLYLPDHVFEAAHGSRRRELRRTVETELVELVSELDAQPVPESPAAQEHYQRALDARDTARRITEDADASDADLVGALVLEDVARQALGDALGRPSDHVSALCALNPTHGRSTGKGRWGSSPTLPLCAACLKDVKAKRAPEVLDDGGRPYLERDTVWARTAFGALVSDLPAEVVRDRVER